MRDKCALVFLLVASAGFARWQYGQAGAEADFRACLANVKKLATAMEMYSTEHKGRYPLTFQALVPVYLREVPLCPAAGRDTYTRGLELGPYAPHNEHGYQDYYYLCCSGENHRGASPNTPWIDGVTGILFRDEKQELTFRGWRD